MKLVAIDMDGTLLTNEKKISKANRQAIKEAKAKGHLIMICSGRPHHGILQFLEENDLSLPLAGSNGAITYTDNQIIHSAAMTLQAAAKVFYHLDHQKHPFKIYTNKGVFTQKAFIERAQKEFSEASDKLSCNEVELEQLIEYQKKFASISVTSFADLQSINGIEIYKFFAFTPHQSRKKLLASALETVEGLTVTESDTNNTEIMGVDGHKGTGIRQMANYYQVPIEDTVAIGDNFNDVPMLEAAGLAIAMGNAAEEVKKICDVTTLTNEEDGVAYAIRKYVLKEVV